VPTVVVVGQAEPGTVTVGTVVDGMVVDGTVGTVTPGVDTVGTVGSVVAPCPDDVVPAELELLEPPEPDEGGAGAVPVDEWPGAPVDAGRAGCFVPAAGLPDPVVVVAAGWATG
jgi:hypothetical protein